MEALPRSPLLGVWGPGMSGPPAPGLQLMSRFGVSPQWASLLLSLPRSLLHLSPWPSLAQAAPPPAGGKAVSGACHSGGPDPPTVLLARSEPSGEWALLPDAMSGRAHPYQSTIHSRVWDPTSSTGGSHPSTKLFSRAFARSRGRPEHKGPRGESRVGGASAWV